MADVFGPPVVEETRVCPPEWVDDFEQIAPIEAAEMEWVWCACKALQHGD